MARSFFGSRRAGVRFRFTGRRGAGSAFAFFTDPRVQRMFREGEIKGLRRYGFTARRVMMNLIKYRKFGRSSAPGRPPFYHTRPSTQYMRNIQAGVDLTTRSIVVGPVLLTSSTIRQVVGFGFGGRTVPAKLEAGGRVMFRRRRQISGPKKQRRTARQRRQTRQFIQKHGRRALHSPQRKFQTTLTTAKMLPRPYAGPTLKKTRTLLPTAFADVFTG